MTGKFSLRQTQFLFNFFFSPFIRYRHLLEWNSACINRCVECSKALLDGFISWIVPCSCSRCTARWRSWSSCWRSAGGVGQPAEVRPNLSLHGLRPATSHSSYPSACDPCHWTRARSSSLAYRTEEETSSFFWDGTQNLQDLSEITKSNRIGWLRGHGVQDFNQSFGKLHFVYKIGRMNHWTGQRLGTDIIWGT